MKRETLIKGVTMLSATVTPAEKVMTKRLDGQVIALNLTSGHYYKLCPVSSAIWDLIEGGARVSDILEALSSTYDAGKEEIKTDLVEVLEFLEREKLVKVVKS